MHGGPTISKPELLGFPIMKAPIFLFPELPELIQHAETIVRNIQKESIEVFVFLADEFDRSPVTCNSVFQFVYRSFYRMDNAGLTTDFKVAYFDLLEQSRDCVNLDLERLVMKLHKIKNRKGQDSLQFSFVTKLAHTVDSEHYPIYDKEVPKMFRFRPPDTKWPVDKRLNKYLEFYEGMSKFYKGSIANHNLLKPIQLFREEYAPAASRVSDLKAVDFFFWAAGKLSSEYDADRAGQ
jgi:hypothetical protein